MFSWYQKAAKCYVFLADVFVNPQTKTCPETSFQTSRWFTRGWTLQELLAPKPRNFLFFSGNGHRLQGNWTTLADRLHSITNIPIDVLNGRKAIADFSFEERMSWAEGRTTKREEDAAHSLMGIFGVYMVPIYGEGRGRAFHRLRKKPRIPRTMVLQSPNLTLPGSIGQC